MKEKQNRSNKHKATVIEVYAEIGQAAVEFYCNITRGKRIECVRAPNVAVGQTGMVDFVRIPNGYGWVFTK